MNPRYVRTMVDRLLSDLERDPRIGRPRSWMGRFGRPLGLGLAMGIGGITGCSGDTLPSTADAYGIAADVAGSDIPNALPEVDAAYGIAPDRAPPADSRDALPIAPDAYGIAADSRDALPIAPDAYGIAADLAPPADTRNALPDVQDAYGIAVDARDSAPPAADGGIDGGGIDGGIDGGGRG